nr:hypothetical protein [Edaphobacter aggregans]
MDVACGQQLAFALQEPADVGVALALWAVPEMAVCPQPEHWSRWPPSAAVRQRVIASSTF